MAMGMARRVTERFPFGIRHKMILCIYLVLLPVLVLSCAVIYYTSYVSTMDVTVRQHRNTVQTIDENIGYQERDLLDIATYITINESILDVLRSDPAVTGQDPLFWKHQAPIETIRSMLAVKNHISTLVLYPENGLPPVYITRDNSVHQSSIDAIRQTPLYARTVQLQGADAWSMVPKDDKTLFISNRSDKVVICRELMDMAKRTKLGFLMLSMDVSNYERLCRGALLHPQDAIVIVSQDSGQRIASVGTVDDAMLTHLGQQAFAPVPDADARPYAHNGTYVFARQRSESGDWIYYLSSQSNWSAWIRSGLIMPIWLGLALLLCILPLSTLATRIITRPVSRLFVSMNAFREGDFAQQVEVVGTDEIAALSGMFNRMVQDIRQLIDRNYVMVLREKESELNALQAQINPHFLYNALDSLYWQATEGGQDHLADNILTLSDLFRFLLSSGQSEVAVSHEARIITSYLQIQKMRFASRLDYTIDIEESIQDRMMPKLLLQPFVENAIVHGLEKKDSGGHVAVSGWQEGDWMRFTIEDNGTGMAPEVIESLLSAPEEKRYAHQRVGHFAIQNVRERLSLCYGDAAELTVTSTLGEGTRVALRIPLSIPTQGNERQ